jgi:FkbM family methyltransferase
VCFVVGDERVRLYCPENEARVAPIEVMNFNHYEPVETHVIDLLTANARNILDVGANIGLYAVRFAKRLPQARIYAFEPMPTSHQFLQRNVAANAVGDRVSCFNYGLSENSGTVEFFISPAAGTNASLLNVAGAQDARRVVGLTLTLDQWAANQTVAPDFIKCDVEGAELLVMRGGRGTLAQYQPIVFAELLRKWSKPFGYHPNDVLAFFVELGYRCLAVGETGARDIAEVTDDTPETNYAFLHDQRHTDLIQRLLAKP